MRKKFLTKLLAFVMSAGLVLQPMAVYAAEPGDADLTDPVVEEVEETAPVDAEEIIAPAALEAEPEVKAAPEQEPVGRDNDYYHSIKNVGISDGVLYWDPYPDAAAYFIKIGTLTAYSTSDTSTNLRQKLDELKAKTNTYTIILSAIDSSWHDLTPEYAIDYYYESPITIHKVTSVSATSDIDSVLVEGNAVKALTFTNISDDAVRIEFGSWQKLENGSWNIYGGETFVPGTYKFNAAIFIKDEHYYDSQLDKECTFTLDGIEYAVNQRNYTGPTNELWCTIYVIGEFEAKESTEPVPPTPGKQIPVSLIEVTSNYDELAKYDAPIIDAKFGETDDDPIEIEGCWTKKSGSEWTAIYGEFAQGIYRYEVDIYVPESYHGMYYLEDDLEFKVNGVNWTFISNDAGTMTFVSEEFDIEKPAEPIEKTKLTSANVTSDYLDGFKYGKPIRKANFSSDDLDLSMFDIGGNWFMDVGNGVYAIPSSKVFYPGTYEYELTLVLKEEYADKYEFDDNFELTVNGTEKWRHHQNKDGDTDRATFYSGYHEITASTITVISSVETTSNIKDIFVNGNDLVEPKFENTDKICYAVCHWIEKDEGSGFHHINVEGKITPGTYRISARVSIYGGFDDEYALSEDTKLIIDGNEWNYAFALATSGMYNMVSVYQSPDIIIDEDIPIAGEGKWVSKYGSTYYVYPGGFKVTGMSKIGDDFYLFSENGTLQSNVFYVEDGNKYYFGADGKMVTGWFDKWGSRYYADEDGVIQTGFVDIGDDTYHFDASGKKEASIWLIIEGKRYYVKADGRVAKSQTINRWGKKYSFDADGVLISK